MYVGTNADNVTGSTIGGWWSTAFSGTWQDLTTATAADSGTSNTVDGASLFVNNTTAGMQNACTTFSYWPQFVSAGGNVVQAGPSSGCIFGSQDKVVKSFKLGSYGFHGGMAQTIPHVAKSVGTAFAPRATCEAKDARGVSRGTTGTCDAGAYQVTKK